MHRVIREERPRLILIGIAVVECQGHDNRDLGHGEVRRRLYRLGACDRRTGKRKQRRACERKARHKD